MKRQLRWVLSISSLAIAALMLSACAKPEAMTINRQEAAQAPVDTAGEADGNILVAAAEGALWYASRLEDLGFYVFPKPEPLPPFGVQDLNSKAVGVDKLAGKVVLLNFWATWCPPCRAEMPSIEILYKKTRDVAFDIMAVSVAEPKKTVTDFLKGNPQYTFPMYLDETGAASAPFAGRGIPTTFILDKQGRAIAGLVGSRMYDGPEVVRLFRELAERLP
ncbi:MAG TPA: TlpA family protein disulfide reductase [Spirochaetaceae bacterium]|jgi:thiol-disulfide isomerase/thioredoxin|nr:TlpA family protein disulfide reductase [Spirochaetaceae bacterium]